MMQTSKQFQVQDDKRIMLALLGVACDFPEQMRSWTKRHHLQDSAQIEDYLAAVEKDHAEAFEIDKINVMTPWKEGVRAAGIEMLSVLDGWVQGILENDAAMGRDRLEAESVLFYPADIRNMINDMCRDLGVRKVYRS